MEPIATQLHAEKAIENEIEFTIIMDEEGNFNYDDDELIFLFKDVLECIIEDLIPVFNVITINFQEGIKFNDDDNELMFLIDEVLRHVKSDHISVFNAKIEAETFYQEKLEETKNRMKIESILIQLFSYTYLSVSSFKSVLFEAMKKRSSEPFTNGYVVEYYTSTEKLPSFKTVIPKHTLDKVLPNIEQSVIFEFSHMVIDLPRETLLEIVIPQYLIRLCDYYERKTELKDNPLLNGLV